MLNPAQDFRDILSTWQTPVPANDNAPITAASFTDLAARRAYVQRPQADPDPVLNSPSLERLGRSSPDAARLWKFWRDVTTAASGDVFALPEIIVDDPEKEEVNPGFSMTEQDLEVRPSVAELQRAWESAPAGRVSVHCVVRNGQRGEELRVIDPIVQRKRGATRIGDLAFSNGRLTRWGYTARGVPLRPREELRAAKGSRKPPPARDLRFLVQTDAPIAKNAKFLAGTVHSTGRSGAPLDCFAEREQSRRTENSQLRRALGAHAEILDMAICDTTAREIGESRGYTGKTAERRGIFLINEALAALQAIVGENILPKAA